MEEGGEREKTRFVSHFPKEFPGLPLCLDAGVRRMAQVCSLRVGREDAWARMIKIQIRDDGTWETRLPPRACSSSNTVTCSSFENQLLSLSPVCE